jgi:hypothetical protein
VVFTYASLEGLGGVVLLYDYVFLYETCKLKAHETNYATHDVELTSIAHALKMWQHYLLGRRSFLKTDNISLKYLFEKPNLNARQERCLAFLSEYNFEIKNIKGKENKVGHGVNGKLNAICSMLGPNNSP